MLLRWSKADVILLLHLVLLVPLTFSAAITGDVDISIPPLLDEGPPKGELLFRVIHDPDQKPENLTIPCKADSLPHPSYSWFKDNHHFYTDGEHVQVVEGEGTLIFPNPQPEDEGEYQCVATNPAGMVYSDIVSVRRGVTVPFPKEEPKVVTAVLGQPLALKCDNPGGYPIPSLHWVLQKSDGALRSVSSERATVDEHGTLWFAAVSLEDASEDALYACATSSATSERQIYVVSEAGAVTLEESQPDDGTFYSMNIQTEYRMGNWVFLNVTIPPEGKAVVMETYVEPLLQYVSEPEHTVLLSQDLKLLCIYGGNPIPKVKWWREDGVPISEEAIVEFGKALLIEDADDDDEATYLCQASSDGGRGPTHSFVVSVEALPVFEEEPGTINEPPGESVSFRCSAKGEPSPMITWTINGEPIPDKHDETLTFESLETKNRGVIACNASNIHGYVYSTGFLNVLSLSPEFTTAPEDVWGLPAEKIIVPCEVYGSPDPVLQWTRMSEDGTQEKIDLDTERFDILDHGLVIKSLSDESSGRFNCTATNTFGSISTSVFVTIMRSTEVDLESEKTLFRAGETVVLRCYVTVDEKFTADVTWMKDNSPVNFGDARTTSEALNEESSSERSDSSDSAYNRILTLKNASGDDSGVYSCLSRTEQGESEESIIIIVEDVPNSPIIGEVECSDAEAYINWSSGGENSSPIIGYIIEMETSLAKDEWEEVHNDIPASNTSVSIKLYPSLNHVFRVTAVNRVGMSEPSLPSSPCKAPGTSPSYSPSNMTVQVLDSSTLQLSWNGMEPIEHNGPGFRYVVSWRQVEIDDQDKNEDEESADEWSKLVIEDWEQTEVEVEGLIPHTEYRVRVLAANDYGEAPPPEDTLIFTEAGVPQVAPTYLRAKTVSESSVILLWVPVPSPKVAGPLMGYEIDIWKVSDDDEEDDGDDERDLIVPGPSSRADLTGLEPYTEYETRVRVLNEKFAGPYTKALRFRTMEGEPSPILNLKARPTTSTSLLIEWEPPANPRGKIMKYLIRYESISDQTTKDGGPITESVSKPDAVWAKLSDLEENTLYRVNVSARNARKIGEWSSIDVKTEATESSIPVPPIFSWGVLESEARTTTHRTLFDRDNDNDIDDIDEKFQNVILADVDGDGDVDEDDVLDVDADGDIDKDDINVVDINNDGVVDERDVAAADRDGDGDVDEYDIGDEDGDGDFDAQDVIIADEDGDGDIDAGDDDGEHIILQDLDRDGDIDENDVTDVDGDGDIDEADFNILDVDNDGDVDEDDVKYIDKDGDGDIDRADVIDLDQDGKIDEDDLLIKDVDNDGDIDRTDYIHRETIIADIDGDGDIDSDDLLDVDGDGDIDDHDLSVADINNDGTLDHKDLKAADRDGDGDVDASDIGDEDGDGDFDSDDVIAADEDGDGDIDGSDDDGEDVLFADRDGDGDLDEDDVTDMDGDGDVDENDVAILDVNDDGKIDAEDLNIIDKDKDGDVDAADVVDFDGDGRIDEDDLEIVDRDGDGDIDAIDLSHQHVYLTDVDQDGDIDKDDVLDIDGDGDVDENDLAIADIDDDGDVDSNDLAAYDKDGDGDIDKNDISDLDGDGKIDEDDFDVMDRDADGDIDKQDYLLRRIFLSDTDGDGDVDKDDVLDTDNDNDIDEHDFNVADINNDGKVDTNDVKAGDRDGDGDVDIADIGDEDGDGDIDGDDVIAADEDGDGDIDAADDDGDSILLMDRDNDGDVDTFDVSDVDGDGDVDEDDIAALDIDNDGDVDEEDLERGDRDGDGDIDAADIPDLDGDGDVDGKDVLISDRDGDGDIDDSDRQNRDLILGDADGDGDVDMEDILDTDHDGDIDDDDFAAADINNDDKITIDDVYAADRNGDGRVDDEDIDDVDGDGDVDASDLLASDTDNDGDIDLADRGEGVNVVVNWQPDIENNPGSEFYIKYRPVGEERWRKSPVESKSLHHTIKGLRPDLAYEIQMVAKDGEFESPSNISIITPVSLTTKDALRTTTTTRYPEMMNKKPTEIAIEKEVPVFMEYDYFPTANEEFNKHENIPSKIDSEDMPVLREYEDFPKANEESRQSTQEVTLFIEREDRPLFKEYPDFPKADVEDEENYQRTLPLDKEDRPEIKEYDDFPTAHEEYETTYDDTRSPSDEDIPSIKEYENFPKANENSRVKLEDTSSTDEPTTHEDELKLKNRDGLSNHSSGEHVPLPSQDDDKNPVKPFRKEGDSSQNNSNKSDFNRNVSINTDNLSIIDTTEITKIHVPPERSVITPPAERESPHTSRITTKSSNHIYKELWIFSTKSPFLNENFTLDSTFVNTEDLNPTVDGEQLENFTETYDKFTVSTNFSGEAVLKIIITEPIATTSLQSVFPDIHPKFLVTKEVNYIDHDLGSEEEDYKEYDLAFKKLGVGTNGKATSPTPILPDPSIIIPKTSFDDDSRQEDITTTTSRAKPANSEDNLSEDTLIKIVNFNHTDTNIGPGTKEMDNADPSIGPGTETIDDNFSILEETPNTIAPILATELAPNAPLNGSSTNYSSPPVFIDKIYTPESPMESPTVEAVRDDADPLLMTWFIVAVMVAVTMVIIVFFSIWVYHQRLSRVSELRAQLYEGYEPPVVVDKKAIDVEASGGGNDKAELEEPLTAEKQRQQMSALLRRQETIQSVDSFASQDDDFAEYGDETMALDLLNSVEPITRPRRQGQPSVA